MAIMVAENRLALRQIEDCEHASLKELPPLTPTLDTLKEYVESHDLPRIDILRLSKLIGGYKNQYYHACYTVVK